MTKKPHDRTRRSTLPRSSYAARLAVLAMAMAVAVPLSSYAAEAAAASGTITGRVLNASTGMYLGKAQISVEGTSIVAATDDYGYFEIRDVPAGAAKLNISYTGLQPTTETVNVAAGERATAEFKLSRTKASAVDKDTVALEEFVVSTERFSNAAEIAINEERFSPTIKNVVAADAFGDIPDGNIGEFVKYIPGVQIGYGYEGSGMNAADSNATSISVRGFGPEMTNITIDGVPVTNASPATLTRAIGLDMQSINNASRVEVVKVPTPDMPSNSPGGSINLVTKSSMEYAKAYFDWKLSMNINSENFGGDMFKKTPGPANKSTYKALPGAEFTYVVPINRKMGFAFTGAWSRVFNENHRAISDYLYDLKDINSGTSYKVDLTAGGGPNVDVKGTTAGSITYFAERDGSRLGFDNPVMYRFQAVDTPNTVERTSGSMKFDWRPNDHHKIAVGLSVGLFDTVDGQRRLQFYPNKAYVAEWGEGFMKSYDFIAKGTVVNGKPLASDFNPASQVAMTVTTRDRVANSYTGYVDYVFTKGPWKIDANINTSKSRGSYKDIDNGHFSELETSVSGGFMSFEGIQEGIPGKITFLDKTGAPIDWTQLASMKAPSIQAKSGLTEASDRSLNAKINVRRDLDFLPMEWLTMSAKGGFYREEKTVKKWGLGTGYKMDYVGPTLALENYLDEGYINVEPGFGLPAQQWLDTYKLYSLWADNPTYFNTEKESTQVGNWNSYANQQKNLKETSDQYYLMFDGRTLRNRMSYVFGVRKEIAKRKGYGTRSDGQWNYVKDANGRIWRSNTYTSGVKIDDAKSVLFAQTAEGTSLRQELTAAGIEFPDAVVASSSLTAAQMKLKPFQDMTGKVTGKPTYSASIAYDITKDLTARVSWNRQQARPDFENGVLMQNANNFTVTEASDPTANPAGTINVANPNLQPWLSDSWDFQLAYYTKNGGKLAASCFFKDTKNFQEKLTFGYNSNEFNAGLAALGLDPGYYENYQLTTTVNGVGTAQTRGYELEASQNLGIFGRFGQMFHVFGSFSHHYKKQQNTNLLSAKPNAGTTASGGVNFSYKQKLNILLRALWVEEKYLEQSTYTIDGVDYVLAKYNPAELNLDVVVRYNLSKRYSLFFNARNVTNSYRETVRRDIGGLVPGYAQNVDRRDFGVNMVFGINGQF